VTSNWRYGNYDARVQNLGSGSEMGQLSMAFNEMAEAVVSRQKAQTRPKSSCDPCLQA